MNILKSKIFFGIVFITYVCCVFTYGNNAGLQDGDDRVKAIFDALYIEATTDPDYLELMKDYKKTKDDRNANTMVCQIVAFISLIFIIYYLFKNLK